jgi:hypothetical protein
VLASLLLSGLGGRLITGDLNGLRSAALATSTRRRLAAGPGVCDDIGVAPIDMHFLESWSGTNEFA